MLAGRSDNTRGALRLHKSIGKPQQSVQNWEYLPRFAISARFDDCHRQLSHVYSGVCYTNTNSLKHRKSTGGVGQGQGL